MLNNDAAIELARLDEIRAGIWKHFKGGLYLVLGYAQDENAKGRFVVVYIPLQLDPSHSGPQMAVRTAYSMDPEVTAWWDELHSDGSKCVHAVASDDCSDFDLKPRFEYLGVNYPGSY